MQQDVLLLHLPTWLSMYNRVTPTAPVVGAITQPTCTVATGSVVLSGLPAGNWTINRGAITGTGATTTITGLATGTYSLTVTNAAGCMSPASANIAINAQPLTPSAPAIGLITKQPVLLRRVAWC